MKVYIVVFRLNIYTYNNGDEYLMKVYIVVFRLNIYTYNNNGDEYSMISTYDYFGNQISKQFITT